MRKYTFGLLMVRRQCCALNTNMPPGPHSPHQRSVLGWPEPGHPYWREDTLAFIGDRYGSLFDPSPYLPQLLPSLVGHPSQPHARHPPAKTVFAEVARL